ncbi:MAG TPA: arsenic resistance N-acetyltransferase ArsN2 [Terriglobia bacterium]|nr:arsenic resistance N-acetyltransferase ArsN2 [Terriglobia bacterium]
MSAPITSEPLSAELRHLLIENNLPTADFEETSVRFYVARAADALLGMVGLECHGEAALLRSLAVAKPARGRGIGTALVRYAERAASTQNVRTVYLLTTTAERFFADLGYRNLPRGDAPASIASTAEFSSLCPTSSAFMGKSL